jgi:mRNA-degrading endonuclease RelE of RelBE toxin-antitoxin system
VFEVILTEKAQADLAWFRVSEQRLILDTLIEQLSHQPITPTRNRKPLHPNPLASWALRLGEYRVFYDVSAEESLVTVRAVGYKEHNELYIQGGQVEI